MRVAIAGSMWPEYFAEVFTPSPRRSDVGRQQQPGVRLYLALVDSFLPISFLSRLSHSLAQMRIPADSGGDYLVRPMNEASKRRSISQNGRNFRVPPPLHSNFDRSLKDP